ncbi:MAG: hypothetical protein ACLFUF_04585 [Opitutales bacterium]
MHKKFITAGIRLSCAFFVLGLPLAGAQEAETKKREIAEPPFEVGDHAPESGYYADAGDGVQVNFRIIENRMYVYWIDEEGLVIEPRTEEGNIRFRGSVRGRPYRSLRAMDEGAGLVASGPAPMPHSFNVLLNLESPGEEYGEDEYETYGFRYTPKLDATKDGNESESEE